jgi:heat shock protein HtpX
VTESVNLFAQQEANRRRTRWLVIAFVLFFAWLGFGGDAIRYASWHHAHPDQTAPFLPWIGIALTAAAIWMAASAWENGAARVLASTGAVEVIDPLNDQQKQLVNVVEEMSVASGLPKPRIWIIPDPDPNAFATGKDEQGSSLAVTQGLLDTLSRDELQAVIGHEMGHIKNLDVRLMTLLAALVGAVTLLANAMSRSGFLGGSRDDREEKEGGGPLAIVLLVLWVVSWVLAPIIVNLMALGVSRDREYLADAMSAQFTRNPMSLAGALQKIESAEAPTKSIHGGAAHMCIADPLGRALNSREGGIAGLFGTHPPMAIRIARLKAMAYQEMKRAGTLPNPDATTA